MIEPHSRARRGPVVPLVRSESGAFDMMSVLVGSVVVAVLAGGTFAATFGVIPWGQDNASRQDLTAVTTAQGVAKVRGGRFLTDSDISNAGLAAIPAHLSVATDVDGTCYTSVAMSASGRLFYNTSTQADPSELTPTTRPACVTESVTRTLITTVGGNASNRSPAPPVLTATLISTVNQYSGAIGANGSFTWPPVDGAYRYRVERWDGTSWQLRTESSGTSHTEPSLSEGEVRRIRVSSLNSAGMYSEFVESSVRRPGYSNIATNAGFDYGVTGYATTGASSFVASVPGWSDKNLIRLQADGATLSQTVSVVPNESYSSSAQAWIDYPTTMSVTFRDSAGGQIGDPVSVATQPRLIDFGSYQQSSATDLLGPSGTVPAGASTATFTITAALSGARAVSYPHSDIGDVTFRFLR
jgi:hypothetical protein